jgi:Cu-Zn family superoxide dismutase
MKQVLSLFILLSFFAGCQRETPQQREQVVSESGEGRPGWREQQAADTMNITKAVAILQSAKGSNVKGTVKFEKVDDGVRVTGRITGLKPGKHGFHIHEFGDLSAPDFSSAGGHFSPLKNQHGAPTDQNRHEGDMGNIEAGNDGTAQLEYTDTKMTLHGMNSIIGHAVIVHENPDDLTSQPAGNAGGIIGIAKK